MTWPAAPFFSLVTAVCDVEAYLPEFIASVDRQAIPPGLLEVIAVDDGSADGSRALLDAWQARRPDTVRVIGQANAGQGAARNAGLDLARGVWVGFPDPDDVLGRGYLEAVARALRRWPEAEFAAAHKILRRDPDDGARTAHPHDYMHLSDRLVDLDEEPDYYTGSVAAGFVRRAAVEAQGLRFDERLRPNFEDAHFAIEYLAARPRPRVAFLASARYTYRKRADRSSTLGTSLADPRRYTLVPDLAYRRDLEATRGPSGYAPAWVQNLVLYDLAWLFKADAAASGAPTAATGAVAAEFLGHLRRIAPLLDPAVVAAFPLPVLSPEAKDVLLHGLAGEASGGSRDWAADYAVVTRRNRPRRLVRVGYRFAGTEPAVTATVDGRPVTPAAAKVRSIQYFGATLLQERILWLPDGDVRLTLGGRDLPVLEKEPRPAPPGPAAAALTWRLVANPAGRRRLAQGVRRRVAPRVATALDRALTSPAAAAFRAAWVLADSVYDADDNSERLFRYLRARRPDVNAWFVVAAGTPDWDRLVRDGYGDRLVAYGTWRWRALMHNCAVVIASHPSPELIQPPELGPLAERWQTVFSEHGVIRDDLSRWLNPKPLDLFVTATRPEHESIAGDGSPYVFTELETKLVGLARFDRLLELAQEYPPEARDLVLVAPTWRQDLTEGKPGKDGRRAVVDGFAATPFGRAWLGLLTDPGLAAGLAARGRHLGFLPHPNLQPIVDQLDLPPSVERLHYRGQDVQRYFARSALLVTDYSSVAFNLAYLERPVVYYQFDRDDYFAGANTSRPGYFDHARDGFGPVTQDGVATAAAILALLDGVPDEYARRLAAAFPLRDNHNCERTVAAIEALLAPA
jgi:GT2 family glycosyltransferase